MAEIKSLLRRCAAVLAAGTAVALLSTTVASQPDDTASETAEPPASAASTPSPPPPPRVGVPRLWGRLHAADLGLVINTADPYSVAVGAYYIERRRLKPEQVLRVELPTKPRLSQAEFQAFKREVDAFFGARTQALALAWTQPFAVHCQAITGALALGFDPSFCRRSCAPSRESPYFNSASPAPWRDLRLRPSMLLAAGSVDDAERLIDRGVAADGSLVRRGEPAAQVVFAITSDASRSVRAPLFPTPGRLTRPAVEIRVEKTNAVRDREDLLLVETGQQNVPHLDSLQWLPGALADHLTSYGGVLDGSSKQTSALAWIESGATASYGTVSEPCNHLQKFPHPQVLLMHYLQGATAIEAYWRSVAWPLQGLFIGEPLAAPFATD